MLITLLIGYPLFPICSQYFSFYVLFLRLQEFTLMYISHCTYIVGMSIYRDHTLGYVYMDSSHEDIRHFFTYL